MFRVGKEQLRSLEDLAIDDFVLRLEIFLAEEHPDRCRELGGAEVRRLARLGVERAERWGMITERAACAYVDAMFSLGADFEANVPWARAILEEPADAWARAERLLDAIEEAA